MHTLLFSKVGSVLALPAIFRPLYFFGLIEVLGFLMQQRQSIDFFVFEIVWDGWADGNRVFAKRLRRRRQIR